MTFSITVDAGASEKFAQNWSELGEHFDTAFSTALNMAASMIKEQSAADIESAGQFSSEGLEVTVDDKTITTTLDMPGASLFESGGTIVGNPLLWLPISGTDAEGIRASNYGDKLFSVNRKAGGPPLLFSIRDKSPKYFGIASVNVPKKFHLGEIQLNVMANFRDIFDTAFKATQ